MEDLLLLVVALGALFLVFAVVLLITNRRRQAEAPFVAERPVPPEVLAALRGVQLAEAAAAEGDDDVAAAIAGSPAERLLTHTGSGGDELPAGVRPLSPGSHVPLVDALVGIDLPCDLTFLGVVEAEAGVREVLAFVTTSQPPHEVDTAFRAELERVGYQLQPTVEANRFIARRSDTSFTAAVHHPAGTIMRGKAQAFPTAPAAAVVVELTYR
jgi:hypothetical protein